MKVDLERLSNAKGMNLASATAIARVFQTWAELAAASAEELVATVDGIDEVVAQSAITFAKIMARTQATASAQVTVDVETAGPAATSTASDPFAAMLEAGTSATKLRFDQNKLHQLAGACMAYVWDIGGVGDLLAAHLNEHGFAFLTDMTFAGALDSWLTLKVNGGEFSINDQKIVVLPWSAKDQIWRRITAYLEDSDLDKVLRDAAAYHRSNRQAQHVVRTGGTYQAHLPSGVEDPDTLRLRLEGVLSDAADMVAGNQIGIRSLKAANEFAYLVIPAYSNAELIMSFGVPVGPGEKPMNAFLTNRKNPHKGVIAAMNFGRALYHALMHLATYDPDMNQDAYDTFFEHLSELGQAYTLAAASFAQYLPHPYRAEEGSIVGFKQIASAVMATIKIRVAGTDVTVSAQFTTTAVSITWIFSRSIQYSSSVHEAMMVLFPSEDVLTTFTRLQLGKNLNAIAGGKDMSALIDSFLNWAARTGQEVQLKEALKPLIAANAPVREMLVEGGVIRIER